MNLADFKTKLDRHDWYYYFSDDHRVWCAGEAASKEIIELAKSSDDFKRAYNEAYAIRFNTPSFVTADRPYRAPFPEVA